MWKYEIAFPASPVLIHDQLAVGSGSDLIVLHAESGKFSHKFSLNRKITDVLSHGEDFIVAAGSIYRLHFNSGKRKVILSAEQPFYRMALAPPVLIASNDLYSVMGVLVSSP